MKQVIFFPPSYPRCDLIVLAMPDTAAAALVAAGIGTYPLVLADAAVESGPIFTTQPSIAGAPQIGQALTGMDGTITGGTVVSRRWLLGAALVSTAQTFLPTAAGALVYEVTATGPGGTTVASSAAVTVAAALPAGALKRFGVVGFNPDYTGNSNYGFSFAFVDRFRTAVPPAYTGGGAPALDARGYPLPQAGKQCETLFNVEASLGPADKQIYVIESNKAGIYFDVQASFNKSTTVDNGVTRFKFNIPTTVGGLGTGLTTGARVFFGGFTTAFADDEYISCYRADEEAEFRSGNMLRQQYIDWHAGFDLRYMDWMNVNNSPNLSDIAKRNSFCWNPRPPLAIIPEYSNRVGGSAYVPINFQSTDAELAIAIPYLLGALPADRPIGIEPGNEGWNGDVGVHLYNYSFVARGGAQVPHTHGGGQNAGYGWVAADLIARVMKAGNYDPRLQGILGSMNTNTEATLGIFEGVRQRILDWNDATSPYYNAEFAGRFKEISDLFVHGTIATYFDADFGDYDNLSAAAKATIDDLANRYSQGDQTAIDAMLQQMQHGNVWQTRTGCFLDNVPNLYGPQVALFEGVGLNTIAYEHQWSSELSVEPKRAALFIAMLHDPRATAVQAAGINANLAIGISSTFVLSDVAEKNGTFASSDFAYDQSAPRFQGILAARANPVAPKPLAIDIATSGNVQVSRNPVHQITVTGGRGIKTVSVTGLAPGQVVRTRGRVITGKLTTAGTYTTTITVTDEWGGSATKTLTQTVVAAPVLPGGRYLRFELYETATAANRNGYTDLDYLGILDDAGAAHAATWAGSDRANGLNAQGDGGTFFSGPIGYVGTYANGDLGAHYPISSLVMTRVCAPGSAPGKFRVWASDTPFGGDASGGTLIFDVNEADESNWTPATRTYNVT